ncbi:glycosyltransferase family 4 protein [Fulvimonas sp. R45]|uniref:glycosyltransferase family 4 protein n=1 Tax=Fulvimonas sp. R45 TaxID=3045937 RepID=UPI00265D7440|nr:glycosyltransferase family 4 protein [Fulvimonas sp. R45]MDO1527782.1 glycosyltransferase family 4 protein [Fulvimonas sp. R45]
MVSTSYPRDAADWRGIFMAHLVAGFARNEQVRLTLWAPPGELPQGVEPATSPHEAHWLSALMDLGGISHLMRIRPAAGLVAAWRLLRLLRAAYRRLDEVDIYHINWLQCALPLPDNGKPMLVTVLGNDMKLLRLPMMRRALRRAMQRRKVAICPNAQWMEAPLRAAFGDIADIVPVAFGIDPAWYAVRREVPPASPRQWLAVTRLTADKLGPLFKWSERLFGDGTRELHLFGPMQEQTAVPDWVHYHGPATPGQLVRDWFPHAQGLITLSKHAEGRPQVMLEAMAAGLPIVASRMPAHADLVADGVTGALCDSPEGYAEALHALEIPETNRHSGAMARAWAAREIGTWDDCAGRYVGIYRRLLGVVDA